jgi:glycosyltransferase involved in cell wall biosynthesis
MRIALPNIRYRRDAPMGGSAHIYQFISCGSSLGHQIYSPPGDEHPATLKLPSGRLRNLRALLGMDAVYYRIEAYPPKGPRLIRLLSQARRSKPVVVYEFNTAPAYASLAGSTASDIAAIEHAFRQQAHFCDLAVCVSTRLRDYVERQLNFRRCIYAPNGSDPDLFRPDLPPVDRIRRDGVLNVVWIGSGSIKWHALRLLRDAAALLQDARAPVLFHLLGSGVKGMEQMPANVHYHGHSPYEMLPRWLASCDVGVVLYDEGPADFGSPLKLFDYMSTGLAVVGTPQPQVVEELQEAGLARFIVDRDPVQLANALQALADLSPPARKEIGLALRSLVLWKYNWKATVGSIMDQIKVLREA